MKNFLIISLFFVFSGFGFAQNLKTHRVNVGESVESIARVYKIMPADIYALNPDVKSNFSVNMILIIPDSLTLKSSSVEEIKELSSYKVYKVKRKETLYGIAQKFNLTVEDIKSHNKRLYSKKLRSGNKIYIPIYKVVQVPASIYSIKTYTVLPKEGIWRIAYKFGISVPELEALNPNMGSYLSEGQQLNVPNISISDIKTIEEDQFGYYEVQAKEGFFRLKIKLGLTKARLEALNPQLVDKGLKSGMVLKVPKKSVQFLVTTAIPITKLANNLVDFSPKNIALLLPFKTKSIDFDSLKLAKNQLKKDGYINISTDFYSGVVMAIDSAKRLGISTKLDVYDTNAKTLDLNSILRQTNFSKYDVVLGPITLQNLELTAQFMKAKKVPVVSPFVKSKKVYSNLFQTIPEEIWLQNKMINFVKKDTILHETLIIYDSKNSDKANHLKSAFPSATLLTPNKNKYGEEQFYLMLKDVEAVLGEGRTFVFLETSNEGFVSNVTSMLNAMNGVSVVKATKGVTDTKIERDITLMTTFKNRAFEGVNISNYDLSNLNFQFPSVNFDSQNLDSFGSLYLKQFGIFPTKYAIRGFDLTMDVLLRLSKFGTLYSQTSDVQSAYIENKFQYVLQPYGGYKNEAGFILKHEDLYIIKVQD